MYKYKLRMDSLSFPLLFLVWSLLFLDYWNLIFDNPIREESNTNTLLIPRVKNSVWEVKFKAFKPCL